MFWRLHKFSLAASSTFALRLHPSFVHWVFQIKSGYSFASGRHLGGTLAYAYGAFLAFWMDSRVTDVPLHDHMVPRGFG